AQEVQTLGRLLAGYLDEAELGLDAELAAHPFHQRAGTLMVGTALEVEDLHERPRDLVFLRRRGLSVPLPMWARSCVPLGFGGDQAKGVLDGACPSPGDEIGRASCRERAEGAGRE